ncbi:MAG: amino acid permease [Chthoniobacterales bacterium]|nr:amino acid permease [Chthoniobacterales bacterium]
MPSPDPEPRESGLIRAIGTPGLTASIINTTVGAGIFVLPATVAGALGPAAPIAFVLCAIAMGLIVTCFALAGSRVSLSGGLYSYVEVAFGPYVGFLAGVLFFITITLGAASVGAAFAGAIAFAFPALGSGFNRTALLLCVFALFASVNILGVRSGTRLMGTLTIIKLVPLLIFVAVGAFFVRPELIALPVWPGGNAVGQSVLLLIFAFSGIEIALAPSGEIKNPARTVPRAIFSALLVTTTLYIAIQLVAQGVLGPDLANFTGAPLAEGATRFLGNFGRSLMLIGGAISALGFISGDILASPRIIYAFSRDGFLPRLFGRVHPRFRTPYVAIITYTLIGLIGAASSTFEQLAVLSNIALLMLYLFCSAATWELIRRDVRQEGEPFRFRGQKAVPIMAAIVIGWILWHATWREFAAASVVFVLTTLLYFIRQIATGRRAAA